MTTATETTMLRINEMDQTIVSDTPLAEYDPPNAFLARLIDEAEKSGDATMDDPEGCPVTAVVWSE